jgi:hypothetical protein
MWLTTMKIIETGKQRFESMSQRLTAWLEGRQDDGVVALATKLYTRDQDAFASVLGSALALRLFLFVIPANVALLGLINLVSLDGPLLGMLEQSPTTGQMAQNYGGLSTLHALWITVSGTILTLWAGRSLARVMATCSAAAWQMHATAARVKLRSVVALTAMLFTLMLASIVFAKMRDIGGPAAAVAAWIAVASTFFVGWFIVELVLPRATPDPSALLPGAALVGLGFSVLQWFMQIYLPGKIARTTDTMGSLAATVATLGYFFFVGRLMSASFVVNAITFQRWGSISQVVFALPIVRRLPKRFPKLEQFFDLARNENAVGDPVDGTDQAIDNELTGSMGPFEPVDVPSGDRSGTD